MQLVRSYASLDLGQGVTVGAGIHAELVANGAQHCHTAEVQHILGLFNATYNEKQCAIVQIARHSRGCAFTPSSICLMRCSTSEAMMDNLWGLKAAKLRRKAAFSVQEQEPKASNQL